MVFIQKIKHIKRYILLFCLSAIFLLSQAQDSLNILQESYKQQQQKHLYLNNLYMHPSQIAYSGLSPYSTINLIHKQKKNSKILDFNQGLYKKQTRINVSTLKYLSSKDMFYGKAYYANSKTVGTNWNTTSDFDLLYPYIMSDTVGGDLNSEIYYFNSGYTKTKKKWTYGARFSYRGLLDYRLIDPRPKNTVANLSLELGTSYKILHTHNLGIDLNAEKYKQSNSVKFFSELGATPLFHIVGLGRDYARFYGDKRNTQYTGKSITGNLSFLSQSKHGISAGISYKASNYQKIIEELNNLPMSTLKEKEINVTIGYENQQPTYTWGITTTTRQAHRKGTENIFGDAVNSEYPKIADLSLFFLDKKSVSLSAMIEYYLKKSWTFSANSDLQYHSYNDQYLFPKRQLKYNHFFNEHTITAAYQRKKNNYIIAFNFHSKSLKKRFVKLEKKEDNIQLIPFVRNLNKYQTSNYKGYNIKIQWEHNTKRQYVFTIGGSYHYQNYDIGVKQSKFAVDFGLIL